MAKVPESLRRLAEEAPTDSRGGTVAWRARLTAAKRDQFDASLDLMAAAQAKGRRISYKAMTEALSKEFGYPFTWGALRHYMESLAASSNPKRRPRARKAKGKPAGTQGG